MLALILSACGTSTEPQLGENFEIQLGTTIEIPDDSTRVKFTDVTSDSRCPTGAQCVWAGEAVVQFTVGSTQQVSLTLGADASKATVIIGMKQFTLVGLKPYPKLNESIAKGDYIATIRFTSAED
ncbi:MAG: hypothetical protein Q8K55_03965 [Gemmatimonadaceae bacterium]|nr:hypothetical protein [Gemmatimonadaceae bacterium]